MGRIFVLNGDTNDAILMAPPPTPNRDEYPYVGTIWYQGIEVYVENEAGSVRSGRDSNGQPWRIQMKYHYGEMPGTSGADGDPIDAYVGPNPRAPMAFVIHQRHYFGTEYEIPGTYDEDKVMLGFDSPKEALKAYAAHFNHAVWTPGYTVLPVTDLRSLIQGGDLLMGTALAKSKGGWTVIPKGKRGGWRRRAANGKWEYKYPDSSSGKTALADDAARTKAQQARLERDASRTTQDLKAGEIVEVGGRSGRYKWVPGAKKGSTLTTAVQSMETGTVELVRRNTLIPLKVKKRAKVKRPPPPPPPPPVRKVRSTDALPDDWIKKPEGPGKTKVDRPAGGAKRAEVWSQSTAKPGTVLEAVENGSMMLRQFQGKTMRRTRLTIHVPADMQNALVGEMTGVFHQAARRVARSFRPPISVVVPGTSSLSSDYKELVAGAQLGFVMALTNYRGGRAFVPIVQDYAAVYALQAARGIRRGFALKERDLRALKGYIAARSRAATVARTKKGAEPTKAEILAQWYLTKRMTFTGRGAKLGSYTAGDRIVDQAHEQVPQDDWQVVTPTGKPEGQVYPGKRKLAAKMEKLLQGEDVPDDDWLQRPPKMMLPYDDDAAMTAGTALHVRREIIDVINTMKDPKRTALAMRFGMHVPEDEDPDALHGKKVKELKTMARDRDLSATGNRSQLETRILVWSATQNRPGTKGYQASASEVADALTFSDTMPKASANAKVRRLWKEGVTSFKRKAMDRDQAIAEYVSMWSTELGEDPKLDGRREGPLLPSHNYLKEQFGTDERVLIYQAGLRAGKGQSTAKLLEREKNGELSPAESDRVRGEYHTQLHREAGQALARYRAVAVDPDKVHEFGPQTGTPGEAAWLYTANVLTDYMRSRIRGHDDG